jgi:integrase
MASVRKRTNSRGRVTYAVLFRHGGKQTSMTFETQKAANSFKSLVEILGPDKALAEATAGEDDSPTLDDLAERFFDWKASRRDVTARTISDYRRDYANWISPRLGHRRAAAVDESDVQELVDHMAARIEPKSVADRHMVLHSIYKWASAKTRRLVDHNPCLETELPKRRRKPPKGATIAEWLAIRDAALRVNPDAADLLTFIVATGWRWSEAAALTPAAIVEWEDEDGREVMHASVGRVFRRDENSRQVLVEDEAKSEASMRTTKLSPTAAAVVRRRMVGKGPSDLIFTNPQGRKWYQTNFLNRTWPRILEAAGIERPITPHWLRHTHVMLLDRTKLVSMPEIQRRLGHESIQTTINVYGRTIDDVSDAALDALDALLTGDRQPIAGIVVRGEVALALDAGEVQEGLPRLP